MNEVSIIINGVRYDAVEGVEICSCKGCEIEDECENVIGLCTNNTVFKKSTQKAFEDGYECATKWIDVKDRLPEKDETVLCAVEHLDGEIHTELRWRTIYNDVQMDENGFSLFTDIEKRVLAWMPLPEYKTNINNKI